MGGRSLESGGVLSRGKSMAKLIWLPVLVGVVLLLRRLLGNGDAEVTEPPGRQGNGDVYPTQPPGRTGYGDTEPTQPPGRTGNGDAEPTQPPG